MKHIINLTAFLCFCSFSNAQIGTLDLSFADSGKLLSTTLFTGYETGLTAQKNNKILIGGSGTYNSFQTFKITRLLNDGSIDESFGEQGNAFISFPDFKDTFNDGAFINALAILPDGKILAAGSKIVYDAEGGFTPSIAFARFTENGKPDSTFGFNGAVTAIESLDKISNVALQKDGKIILVGGSVLLLGGTQLFVYRFMPNGTLDENFAGSGKILTKRALKATSVAVQSNGNIVVGGVSGVNINSDIKCHIERYNPDGSIDKTFGNGGIVETAIGRQSSIESIALDTDEKNSSHWL